ncbi:unnamed protein product [Choristocarpus tenellus]
MRMMDMDAPPGEDVLTASDDTLPNRTPFEMQYELFKRGMELEAESKYEAAERQWTEVIDNFNSPNFRTDKSNKYILARAYSNRGNTRLTLQARGLTTEAILDYSASIELVPERGEFWLNRGVAYEDMADRNVLSTNNKETVRSFYESALADYDHAVVLDPQVCIMPCVLSAPMSDSYAAFPLCFCVMESWNCSYMDSAMLYPDCSICSSSGLHLLT